MHSRNKSFSGKAFIDNHQMALAEFVGLPVDRLDPGHDDGKIRFPASHSCGIDPRGRFGPEALQCGEILRNQFLHMHQEENSLSRPSLENLFDERRLDGALPGSGRKDQDRISSLRLEPAVNAVDGFSLIGAKLDHRIISHFSHAALWSAVERTDPFFWHTHRPSSAAATWAHVRQLFSIGRPSKQRG